MSFGVFQFRRDTAAGWTSANPVISPGELVIETDTAKFKIGTGANWNSTDYGGLKGDTGAASTVAGPAGDKGWSPIAAVVPDGERRVLQITDWTGGTGTKPSTTNQFVGPTGIVGTAAQAADIRGPLGPASTVAGPQGDKGWSPLLSAVVDGERVVLQVTGWVGGAGASPATGSYLADSGYVATKAEARNIRGATGPSAGATVVNAVTQFGADPTGATDSTAAIQSAINSVAPGGRVFCPKGRYKIATPGYGTTVLADSPAFHYRFEQAGNLAVGAAVADASPNARNGTVASAAMNKVTGSPVGTGSAISASSETAHITTTYAPTAGGSITLEAWVNRTNTTTVDGIFGNSAILRSGLFFAAASNSLSFRANNTDATWTDAEHGMVVGTWYHVAVAFDTVANTATLYVNGVSKGAKAQTAEFTADTMLVGSLDGSSSFTGSYDEAAVYPSVLSAERIAAHYAARAITTDTAGMTVGANHCVLEGEGRGDTTFFTDHPTASLLTLSASSWFSGVRDIGFDNANANGTAARVTRSGGWAVDLANANYGFVEDCDFNWHGGNVRSGGHLQFMSDLNIRNFAQWSNGVGILCEGVANGNDKLIEDITMDSVMETIHADSAGIRVKQIASLRIDNCNLVHCGAVLDLFPDSGQVIPSIYATNTFFDQGLYCMRVRGAGSLQRSAFVNCWFSGNPPWMVPSAGVRFEAGTIVQGVDFTSCHFLGNAVGIDAVGGATELDWSVTGSRFAGNTTAGIRTTAGANHRFNVVNNRMGQSAGFLVNNLGIDIGTGTYLSYQIVQNRGLDNNTIPGIRDAGTTPLRHNKQVTGNMGALTPGILAAITADVAQAVNTGTTEQIVAQARIPANAVAAGVIFRVLYKGILGATVGNPTVRVRIGAAGTIAGDTVIAIAPTATGVANGLFRAEINMTVRSAPTSGAGSIQASSIAHINATASQLLPAAVAMTPSAVWFITVTHVTSAAGAVLTARNCYIEAASA